MVHERDASLAPVSQRLSCGVNEAFVLHIFCPTKQYYFFFFFMFLHVLFLMPCHRNGSFSFAGHASFSLLSRQPRYCLKNLSCLYQPACAMEKQKWYLKTNDTTKKGGFVEETHEAKATLTRDEVLGTCRG